MTKAKNQSKREMNPKQMNMKKLKKGERGFSLVELVIVVALAGLVGAAITATAFQVFTFSTRLSNQMTAVRQVQQAGFWVSPDVMMSNRTKINVNPGGGKFLVLDWTAHDGKEHEVTYTITVDDRLQRTHNITVGGQTTMEVSIIAEYINSTQTSCVKVGGALNFTVVFNVTATVGGQTETRIYQVKPRQGT